MNLIGGSHKQGFHLIQLLTMEGSWRNNRSEIFW